MDLAKARSPIFRDSKEIGPTKIILNMGIVGEYLAVNNCLKSKTQGQHQMLCVVL